MKKNCYFMIVFIFIALLLNCQEDEEISANIDERLIGKWAQYDPAEFMGDKSKGYNVYNFYKNGKYNSKFCKDTHCDIVKYTYILEGIYNIEKDYYLIREKDNYINNNLLNIKIIKTYFINDNIFYYGGVYVKIKSFKDNTIYGKYEKEYKTVDMYSETEVIYNEHIRCSTIDIKIDNTINETEYYKDIYDNKEDFNNVEKTTVIYDNYEFEDLGDRFVIKFPEKKYYTDEGNGPYYLHDIVYYENYGDVIRWGSKDVNGTPAKPPPYYKYNSEKGVLENTYGFYEPYKKVE